LESLVQSISLQKKHYQDEVCKLKAQVLELETQLLHLQHRKGESITTYFFPSVVMLFIIFTMRMVYLILSKRKTILVNDSNQQQQQQQQITQQEEAPSVSFQEPINFKIYVE
jgi:heme exporter protein D